MNKSLKTIQTLSKIGKILSKIAFVFNIVLFCVFILGLVAMLWGITSLTIDGTDIASLLEKAADVSVASLYSAAITGMISTAGGIFMSKTALNYFKRELNDGTPFTVDGADQMLKFGIITLCVSFGTQLIANIANMITASVMSGVKTENINNSECMIIGVMFIFISFVCKYGAEVLNEKNNASAFAVNTDSAGLNTNIPVISSNVTAENFNVTDETVTFPVTDVNAGDKKTSDKENDG